MSGSSGEAGMNNNVHIYDGFICLQTGKVCDTGWCNVMVDVVNDFAPCTCVPAEYTSHSDYRDRCKNCDIYQDFMRNEKQIDE